MRKILVFFLFISSITMFFWFKEHAILFLGDEPFIYNPEVYKFRRSFSWVELSGGYLSTPVSAYYISLWNYILASLGLHSWMIQAITFFLLLFLQFYSIFVLSSFILKNKFSKETSSIYVCSFLGSLVYVFNTYQMTSIWTNLKGLAYSAAFYPLFLYSIFRILSGNKNVNSVSRKSNNDSSKLKYALIGAISLFFTVWGTPKIWIPTIIYTLGFVVWGFVYFSDWKEEKPFRATIRRVRNGYLILMLVVSSLLLVPIMLTIFLSLTSIAPTYTLPKNTEMYIYILKIRSKETSLVNTFHFWGMNMLNEPVYTSNKILENVLSFLGTPVGQFILFIPTIIIFSSLILEKRLIQKFIVLYTFLLVTITGISIIHVPLLGDVYLHIYGTTHILTIFNNPWSNFGLFYILLVSLLTTISLFLFLRTSKGVKLYLLVILLLLFYLIPLGYLFVTGKFIPQEGLFNSKVKVPDYVLESLEFTESKNSQSKNKILFLPYFKGKEVSNWEWSYWGHNILIWLTKDDAIGSGYYAEQNLPLEILSEIQNKKDLYLISTKYNLKLPLLKTKNLVKNPSFEEYYVGPKYWKMTHIKDFNIRLDSNSHTGRYSLKVSTITSKPHTWSWIKSEPINVETGRDYIIVTHMKYYNVKQSHIKIEAYYPKRDEWTSLNPFIPPGRSGNSEWQEYKAIVKVPEGVTKIRVVLNAGRVLDKSKGEAITWFDDILIYDLDDYVKEMSTFYMSLLRILGVKWVIVREDLQWTPLISKSKPDIHFIEDLISTFSGNVSKFGKIKIFELSDTLPPVYIAKRIILTNFSDTTEFINSLSNIRLNESNIAILDNKMHMLYCEEIYKTNEPRYQSLKLNPILYKVHIYKSDSPILLILLQNYDIYWSAYIIKGDKRIKIPDEYHFIVNGFANGWYINKTGSFEMELYYEPQKYYEIGLIISKIAFATCLIILVIPERRFKNFANRIIAPKFLSRTTKLYHRIKKLWQNNRIK